MEKQHDERQERGKLLLCIAPLLPLIVLVGQATPPDSLARLFKELGLAAVCAALLVLLVKLYNHSASERKEYQEMIEDMHKQQMETVNKSVETMGEMAEVHRRLAATLERVERTIDRCPHSSPPGPRD